MMGYEFGPGLEYAVLGLEVLAEANGAVPIRASGMRRVGVAAFKVCDLLGESPGRPVTCATPLGLSSTTSDLITTGTHYFTENQSSTPCR